MSGRPVLIYHAAGNRIRHHERTLLIQLGPWAGADVRPTRAFLWIGTGHGVNPWILSTGSPPKLIRRARRRHLQVRGVYLTFLGNPVLTLLLFVSGCARTLARPMGHRM